MSDFAGPSTATGGVISETPPAWRQRLRVAWANFWREFMFWWTEYAPEAVLWTRPFFLWFAWRFAATLRTGTLPNARRLLGPGAHNADHVALAKATVHNCYLSVYELGRTLRLTRKEMRDCVDAIEGQDTYLAARRAGKGAVVVTAHLGSFELGAAALLDREARLHVVFRRDAFPRFERLRSRLRARLGVVEAPVDDGWSTWVRLRDALRANEVVMIQGDRVMPGQKGVPVPFFDGHLLMPTGPLKLALATGAPLIPIFSIRTGVGRVRVIIEEPILVSRDDGPPTGRHPAMRKLAKVIEKHVRAHPEQWLIVEPAWCEDRAASRP